MKAVLQTISFFIFIIISAAAFANPIADEKVERIIKKHRMIPSQTSIAAAYIDDSSELMSYNEDLTLNPASVTKLLTTTAALTKLGTNYRFLTWIGTDKWIADGKIHNLYIKGSGDPSLVVENAWRLAQMVKLAGVDEITGKVIIDNSFFDGKEYSKQNGETTRAYAAYTSPFAINFNTIPIGIRAGNGMNKTPKAGVDLPGNYASIKNLVKRGNKFSVSVESELKGDREFLTVRGTLPAKIKEHHIYRKALNPTSFSARTFIALLKQNSVTLNESFEEGTVPPNASEIITFESDPLSLIIQQMNKFSNNFTAEQITKHLGAVFVGEPGTTENGISVIKSTLGKIGIKDGEYFLENGSGLSTKNRISASQIVKIIKYLQDEFSIGPEAFASLPISGTDGTLNGWSGWKEIKKMMRAKTGTLNGVISLGGITTDRQGRLIAFGILTELPAGRELDAKRMQLDLIKMMIKNN
ncbi:MAG: D-alanyl-D-alanine carboxypeptidase/D-alanyl-D-alanine-endopeptidase [Pseudomonadota bacterium]